MRIRREPIRIRAVGETRAAGEYDSELASEGEFVLAYEDAVERFEESRVVGVPSPGREPKILPLNRRFRRYTRKEITRDLAPDGISAIDAEDLRRRLAALRESAGHVNDAPNIH